MYQKSNIFKVNINNDDKNVLDDGKCAYSEYGKRCPLPGSVSCAVRKGGTWYCSGHSLYNDGVEAHNILNFNLKNYDLIIHSRNCQKYFCDKCEAIRQHKNESR